jgi:hypothetical protein
MSKATKDLRTDLVMSRVETPGRLKYTGIKAMKELFLEILLNENIHTFIQ